MPADCTGETANLAVFKAVVGMARAPSTPRSAAQPPWHSSARCYAGRTSQREILPAKHTLAVSVQLPPV
jgi:hypothetical protein